MYALIVIAVILLIYQLFFANNPDELDDDGNPVYKKRKRK